MAWFSAFLLTPVLCLAAAEKHAHSKSAPTSKPRAAHGAAKPAVKAHSKAQAGKTARKHAAAASAKVTPPPQSRFAPAAPGSLQALAHAYREKPSAASSAALERYAREHAGTSKEGLALLALATAEVEHGEFSNVVAHAEAARKRLPELSDYAVFLEANAYSASRESGEVQRVLTPLWDAKPESPLATNAAVLQAKSFVAAGQPEKALSLLKKYNDYMPAPRAALATGQALEAAGRKADAARSYQTVFYDYPLAGEAGAAAKALESLCSDGGCPAAGGDRILSRARALLDGGQAAEAEKWLQTSVARLRGADLDTARVLLGACKFSLKMDAAAYSYLQALKVEAPEADAERLYYLVRVAERMGRTDDAVQAVQALGKSHAASPWRERALIAEANRRVVDNAPSEYVPLFRACYESFPDSSDAAYCHWRVTWSEYLEDRPRAEAAFKAHLTNYPKSVKANAALYFLGRIAEGNGKPAAAKAWYAAAADRYPNSYYGVLARERMQKAPVSQAAESTEIRTFLSRIPKPVWPALDGFEADPATTRRINRSRLLDSAGLEDYAERELRFGAENDGQPQVIAMELAELANRRGAPDQAIRYIKRYVPNYLSLPLDAAPEKFWQLAFPLPYRRTLEQYCAEYSLDPYFVAALVRQESEFNTRAVSYAKAVGLTQVMPSTGHYLSRKLNIPRFHTASLFEPDINLKIGSYYIRALLDGLQGSEEAALASYNAGKSRVNNWLTWSNYREPAEFVESIPFLQTRDYVQVVLHNADIYRRLYRAAPGATTVRNRTVTPVDSSK